MALQTLAALQHNGYLGLMYRSEETPVAMPTGPAPVLFEAIATKRCVEAAYNGGHVVLAPHVAFVRHGAIYIGAITITRDGRIPREEKIGIFKLDGLVDLQLSDRIFARSPAFDPRDERFAESTLIAAEA
ncbi:WYL domain-containing protein [Sphingomonas canadensis]|uniref:WYL domain-containing protein n=1 Tax=Sphingomonas canadensis TaxID=1219257 RepID=A0ABW3HF23_9SPHN|nr:WYL domain-containing protein [Sphingomonas canadensis]MCW3837927.1 WYL domain-containing protein [Sphingomonas canadensis]